MVLLTVIFLVVFVAPFFIISAIKERREKREEAQQNATSDQSKQGVFLQYKPAFLRQVGCCLKSGSTFFVFVDDAFAGTMRLAS